MFTKIGMFNTALVLLLYLQEYNRAIKNYMFKYLMNGKLFTINHKVNKIGNFLYYIEII